MFAGFKVFINTYKWRIMEPRRTGGDCFWNHLLVALLPERGHAPARALYGPLTWQSRPAPVPRTVSVPGLPGYSLASHQSVCTIFWSRPLLKLLPCLWRPRPPCVLALGAVSQSFSSWLNLCLGTWLGPYILTVQRPEPCPCGLVLVIWQ